jgi:hypothetical protein
MNREAIYEAWVPQAGVWSLWARPVLFGQMSATRYDLDFLPYFRP